LSMQDMKIEVSLKEVLDVIDTAWEGYSKSGKHLLAGTGFADSATAVVKLFRRKIDEYNAGQEKQESELDT